MNRLTRSLATVAGAAVIGVSFSPSAMALGFRDPDQSAAATGQGEAFVAQADDASAVYYNPAGLTQLNGTAVTVGAYWWMPDYRFNGVAGKDEMDKSSVLPHFYVASDLGTEKWRF